MSVFYLAKAKELQVCRYIHDPPSNLADEVPTGGEKKGEWGREGA